MTEICLPLAALRERPRMLLRVELTESQLEALRQATKALGIAPEQLAAAAIADLVTKRAEDSNHATTLSIREPAAFLN